MNQFDRVGGKERCWSSALIFGEIPVAEADTIPDFTMNDQNKRVQKMTLDSVSSGTFFSLPSLASSSERAYFGRSW